MDDSAIFVPAKGRIVGSVTHAALLEGKGFVYYAIWRQQIGKWPA